MTLWRLTPVEPADAAWEGSSHRGPVVVRAPSERQARELAERAFGVKTRFEPGAGVKAPPWLRPALVRAEPVADPRYSSAGPPEILFPAL